MATSKDNILGRVGALLSALSRPPFIGSSISFASSARLLTAVRLSLLAHLSRTLLSPREIKAQRSPAVETLAAIPLLRPSYSPPPRCPRAAAALALSPYLSLASAEGDPVRGGEAAQGVGTGASDDCAGVGEEAGGDLLPWLHPPLCRHGSSVPLPAALATDSVAASSSVVPVVTSSTSDLCRPGAMAP